MTIRKKLHAGRVAGESEDYRGAHEAPDQRDAPLWDLTGGGVYPKDVYQYGQRYYGIGDGSDSYAWSVVFGYRNRR